MRLAEHIAERLGREGVSHVFEVVGGTIAPLIDALDRRSAPRLVSMRHEQAAAFAADGAARMTGVPGVAMATSGPGATNLLTGVGSCYFDSTPAVFLCGQVPTGELRGDRPVRQVGFQETDVVAMAKPITKAAWQVASAEEAARLLGDAFALARAGRPGPVLLDLPMDLQSQDVHAAVAAARATPAAAPDADAVERALGALRRARRPLILAGGGVRSSGAVAALRAFAAREQVPVVHSLMGVDVLPFADPLRVGLIGTYGNRWANAAVAAADLLLVLGSRLDIRQTGADVAAFAAGRVIHHVDCDPAEVNHRVEGCHAVIGDVGAFLAAALDDEGAAHDRQEWLDDIAALRQRWPDAAELADVPGINPNAFMHALARATPQAAAYVSDVGQHQMWAAQSLELAPDQRFVTSGGMGAMGFGLPAGIGAALAGGGPVVVIAGDGGLQLNIQELQTIAETGAPVTVVVLDNGAHGMVRQFQDSHFEGRTRSSQKGYSAPDFERVAKAYGLPAATVSDPADVERALAALDPARPQLLRVVIDARANAYPKLAFGRPLTEMEPLAAPVPLQRRSPVALSICIPTHHGRRDELVAAVSDLLAQAGEDVEICISDNASADGTEEAVAELAAAHPGRIVYRRNDRNLGVGRNVLAVVDMARGEWCWLFGSDDRVAEGAVARVLDTVRGRDDLIGVTMARANYDRTMAAETVVDLPAILPSDPGRPAEFADARTTLAELGVLQTYITSQVVRRGAWNAAVAAEPDRDAIARLWYPHTYVIGRMLLAGGSWAWIPDKLVLSRTGNISVRVSLGTLMRELSGMWKELLGPSDPVRRDLDRRIKAVLGPHRMRARRLAAVKRLRRVRMGALPPAELQARVVADVPGRVGAARTMRLTCSVTNHGSRTFRSSAPHPVRLAARWHDAAGNEVRTIDRGELAAALRPGAHQELDLFTPTPDEPGTYTLTVGLVQELVAWFDDVDPASATTARVQVLA